MLTYLYDCGDDWHLATASHHWLLHRVGAGLKLTAAGWLPPAVDRDDGRAVA